MPKGTKPVYIIGWNQSGYLPDSEPCEYESLAQAKAALRESILNHRDWDIDSHRAMDLDNDSPIARINVWTPLSQITLALLERYGSVEYADYGGYVYWIAVEPR